MSKKYKVNIDGAEYICENFSAEVIDIPDVEKEQTLGEKLMCAVNYVIKDGQCLIKVDHLVNVAHHHFLEKFNKACKFYPKETSDHVRNLMFCD